MTLGLHADHNDITGAYWPKYLVIKELFDKGMLNDVPDEFKPPQQIAMQQEESNSWKKLLKEIIEEEKAKLNI